MKVLFLTKYTDLGPSSRMRTFQYLESYKEAGIVCDVQPFFNNGYLKEFYSGEPNKVNILFCYFRRFLVLFSIFKYDKIYIEKEIFPYLPSFAEFILHLLKKEYMVDYDDAIFHNYDRHPNFLIRGLLKNKIDNVMKYATVVTAGNEYLAKRAVDAGAPNIEIIPTVIDLKRYQYPEQSDDNDQVIVGWIGTKTTFEKHLLFIKDWLIKAQQLFDIQVHIIGIIESEIFLGDHVVLVPWTEETEVANLSKIDIGIMPLRNSPWEEGKCAYKIIQYMACGKPVIASNVGMNSELCINDQTGFLADSEEEFLNALGLLINNEKKRNEMGRKGRDLVENKYNLKVTSEIMIKLLKNTQQKQ